MASRRITDQQVEELLAAIERRKAEQARVLPDEQTCLQVMFYAWERLKELGWREAMYCPKDGTQFQAIEAGSTGIFPCHYEGEWPKGSWWAEDGGDLWPSSPILFKQMRDPETGKPWREVV